jgi:hypothetical protein
MFPRRERRSGKEKDKKKTTITHQCKDPNNHSNHCNIDDCTKDKCYKPHIELNPKDHKKDANMNLFFIDSRNQIESNSKFKC